jgi:hypothetical protein
MVRVTVSGVVGCRFDLRSHQTKDYNIGICYFSARSAKEQEQRLVSSESE